MKKTILIFFVLLASSLLFADDVIILRSSVRIDGKIESISNTELRYKKANNLTGPTFITPLADVSLIILENGEVLSYTDVKTEPTNNSTTLAKKDKIAVAKSPQTTVQNKTKRNLTPSDRTLMGVSVGFALRQTDIQEGPKTRYVFMPTYQLGYIFQPEFKYGLGVKTGVDFEFGGNNEYRSKQSIINISMSIPLQGSYRCEWSNGLSTLFYTGPIFDFGMLMKIKVGAQPYSEAYNLYSDGYYGGYEGFNCLWGFGIAAQHNRWRFAFDAGVGIVHTIYGGYRYFSINGFNHKPMTLSIAYMFNRKKDN